MDVGNAIKELRLKARLSQKKLAEKSKLTQGYVSNVENGRQHPSDPVLKRICRALNAPMPLVKLMSIDILNVSPKHRPLFARLKKEIDQLTDDTLNKVYGRR